MSYLIVFQTKFINLTDGRLIHLTREGCNNDTEGREPGVFRGKLYTKEEFETFKEKQFADNGYEGWDLKLGRKFASLADYRAHLTRMQKRAVTWDALREEAAKKGKHIPYVKFLTSVDVKMPGSDIETTFTPEEWEKVCYDYWIGYQITYHFDFAYSEEEIVALLESKHKAFEFHIA